MAGAIFAGTFDPPTLGHMDVITRAAAIFDGLRVVVADNSSKRGFFSAEERIALLETCCKGILGVSVHRWDGLVSDFARSTGCSVLVRGVRDSRDAEYEKTMAYFNRRLEAGLETVFIFCEPGLADISSSAARELATRGRMPSGIVPPEVLEALEARFGPLRA